MASTHNIETRLLKTSEYELWDQFVDSSPFGTIFHKSIWLQPVAGFQQLSFDVVGCFKGGQLTGGMALAWKKKFGKIPVIQMPLKTPFFGPVISYSDTKYRSKIESQVLTATTALTDFLKSRYQHIHAQFPPAFTDVRPYVWNGFEAGVHYTYMGDLTAASQLLEGFDSDIKRRIKKARELDHQIIVESSEKNIAFAWELEQASFKRQNFGLVSLGKEEFTAFIRKLAELDAAEVHTITHEGSPVASVVSILDKVKNVAYYWMAGAQKESLSTGLNQLLIQDIVERYINTGLEKFDLVGADTDTIARYKSTLNFPLVPIYSVTHSQGLAKKGMQVKKLIRK